MTERTTKRGVKGLLERETARLDTWLDAAWPSRPPAAQWATEHTVEPLRDTVTLRVFGDADSEAVPVLIATPQVNHSYIADFAPDQSLVRTLLEGGVGRVGVTDWQPPPRRSYSIADSIDDLGACVEALGGRVHLVGLCQGGWQSLILAALQPDKVASLTLAAAPVDTHAGQSALHAFTLGLPMAFFRGIVAAGGGVAPGRMIAAGFDLLRPFERFVYNYASLYFQADSPSYVDRYRRLKNWYRLNKDIAGTLYLEAVEQLFKENRLARSELEIRGERVVLERLTMPLHLVAGRRDHITPPEQVFALAALAPHAPSRTYTVDAGHIGVFMGRTALATTWPELAATYL
jgi:poly(3-hydroxybutyrate) depolymerase